MFTDRQVVEIQALAAAMVDPLVSDLDKWVLAEMLRVRHQMEGSK